MKTSNNPTPDSLTFSELCKACGKSTIYMRNLQNNIGVPVLEKNNRHSAGYVYFMQKIVSLRTFSVPLEEIVELFAKEKSVLCLLKMDSLIDSATWHLDQCNANGTPDCRLFLTGYNVGFPIEVEAKCIQTNLDFGSREKELFNSMEMGEDIRQVLDAYLKSVSGIKSRVKREKHALLQALVWEKTLD